MQTLSERIADINPEITLSDNVENGLITFKQELPYTISPAGIKTRISRDFAPVSVILETEHSDEISYFIMDETKKIELVKFLINTLNKDKKCMLLELLGKDLSEMLSTVG